MMQMRTKKHSIKGHSITVKLQPPLDLSASQVKPLPQPDTGENETECDTLQVSGLPPNADGDILQTYFEGRKSGGCVGAVQDYTFISPGVAKVKFASPKGSYVLPLHR